MLPLLLLLAGGARQAAAAEECGASMTFFPPGAEDFNVPVAWGRSQQRKAGNRYGDQLFTVLLSSRDNLPGSFAAGVPTLQVLPTHPLLHLGASGINVTCRGGMLGVPPLPKTKLDADDIVEAGRVVTVPRVRISYRLRPELVPDAPKPDAVDRFVSRYGASNATVNPDMAEAELARQIAKLTELSRSSNETAASRARKALAGYEEQQRRRAEEQRRRSEETLAAEAAWYRPRQIRPAPLRETVTVGEFAWLQPVPRIKLEGLEAHPDGYYCMEIVVTILRATGYINEYAVPTRDLTATREVCFYKLDAPPSAKVRFDSCGDGKFAMTVTDVQPAPVEVFPGTGKSLFTPVYHFKATLNRTAKWWEPVPEGHKFRFDYWAVVGRRPGAVGLGASGGGGGAGSGKTGGVVGIGGGNSSAEAAAAAAPAPARYEFVPDDSITLAEGWWSVEVDGSLVSEFPTLLSMGLSGKFGKKSEEEPDEMGVWADMPPKLQGLPRYGAGRSNLTKLFGLQSRETGFNSFNGPDGGIPLHEDFQFSW